MKYLLPILLIFTISFSSCKKFGKGAYRNDYVGNYNFTVEHNQWSAFAPSSNSVTTSIGKIEIFTGFTGNDHDIHHKIGVYIDTSTYSSIPPKESPCIAGVIYYSDNFYHPTVSKQGSLSYPECDCADSPQGHYQFMSGQIWPDSIRFIMDRSNGNHGSNLTISGGKIP